MRLIILILALGSYFQPDQDEVAKGAESEFLIRTVVGADNLGDGLDARQAVFLRAGPVATDSNGNVYVSDNTSNSIRRIDAATGIISTVAGNGQQGFSGDGGPALAASFFGPGNLQFDDDDNLFVADARRIRRIDGRTGVIITIAGTGISGYSGDGGPAIEAELSQVIGLAIHADWLYLADRGNHVVRRIHLSTGIIETFAGTGRPGSSPDGMPATTSALNTPEDVAVDSQGRVFIADPPAHRIRVVPLDSGIMATAAGSGFFGFSGDGGPASRATIFLPSRLALDRADNLFFSDVGNYRVRRIDGRSRFVSTVAGNGDSNSTGAAGPATAVGVLPVAIAVSRDGELVIAEGSGRRVRRVDSNGTIATIAGGAGFSASAVCTASLADGIVSRISGVTTDANGVLYVADGETHTIVGIDLFTGTMTVVAGTRGVAGFSGDGGVATEALLDRPTDVAVDGTRLYLTDTGNGALRVVDLATGRIDELAPDLRSAGRLGFLTAIAVAPDGTLYLVDGNEIISLDASGSLTTVAGSARAGFRGDGGQANEALLNEPRDIALDRDGGLLVADSDNNRIRRIDLATGSIETVAGTGVESTDPGVEPAPARSVNLLKPSGVAVDAAGNIYVADTLHQRLRRIDPAGSVTTIAGTGRVGDSGDGGRASASRLRNPTALAVDPFGRIFVNDQDGIRLRVIEARGSGVPLPANVDSGDRFGQTLAAAGNWFAVGAPNDELGSGSGSVVVYRTDGCRASLAERLEPPPGFSAESFGRSLAMTEDRLAVGARPGQTKGSALQVAIYERLAQGWRFKQPLTSPDAGNTDFGAAIALTDASVAVGAPGTDDAGAVFQFSGTDRVELTGMLRPEDDAPDFGSAVTASGNNLAVGSPTAGRVDVYDLAGSGALPALSITSPAAGFGSALAADADQLVIGAPAGNDAFLVALDAAVPLPESLAPGSLQAGSRYGAAVAIAGNRIVVGAPGEANSNGGTGALFEFTLDPGGKGTAPPAKIASAFFQQGLGIAAAVTDNLTLGGAPDTADERGDVVAVPAGARGADSAVDGGFTVGAQICESRSPVTFGGLQWREQALLNTAASAATVVCSPPFRASSTTIAVRVSALNGAATERTVSCELRDVAPSGLVADTRACTVDLPPGEAADCTFPSLNRGSATSALTVQCELEADTGIARLRYSYES